MIVRYVAIIAVLLSPAAVWPGQQAKPGGPAAAATDIAIIVNPSNPIDNLTRSELRRIFMLETQNWPHGRKVTVVLDEKGNPSRAQAIRLICGVPEAEYDRHILLQTFRGSIGWGPRDIGSVERMLRFVFNVPGAIGYVPSGQAGDTTKVVRIDGHAPGELLYALRVKPVTGGDLLDR